MFLDYIREFFEELIQSTIAKVVVLAVIIAVVLTGFIRVSALSEELACNDYGGKYIEGTCTYVDDLNEYAKNYLFVTGNTANSPKPVLNDNIKNSIKYSILENKKINAKMISVSKGNQSEVIRIDEDESGSVDGIKKTVENATNNINEKIGKAPSSDGAIYFEAIVKAGREAASINKKSSDGSVVVVFGSGLSDGGVLNFADNDLLSMNTQDVVNALKKAGQLDDKYLDGVKIEWYGIGQVVVPQDSLSSAEIIRLKKIYEDVFLELGAEIEYIDLGMDSETINENKHTVKTTKVSDIIIYEGEFDDKDLSFSANSAMIMDEEKARNALSELIERAKKNPNRKIIVTGYMAAGNCSGTPNDPTLSFGRANAVKSFLIKNGLKNEIEVVDGGVFDPGTSECEKNVWKPELANYRRKVKTQLR